MWLLFLFLFFKCCVASPPNLEIEYVHLVFSNHLDVGFTDFALDVINLYFYDYFPQIIQVAQLLEKEGYNYVFTTHAWLISLYLDCPGQDRFPGVLFCPSDRMKNAFIDAINKGIVTWHGFPFNVQFGAMDADMIKVGVDMVHDLDRRFNFPHKRTVSQRDIPGMSVATISPLLAKGIEAITVGVNGASAPPGVPPIFVWKKPGSQDSILAMWHPGEYGGLNVSDAVIVPGLKHALVMNWRPDNYGPGDSGMNMDDFEYVQSQFPNAKVVASTLDKFLDVVLPFKDKLPVIESEIGDTWIWGVQSDPYKMQAMRQMMRLRKAHQVPFEFDRLFLKAFEHTWGYDPKRTSFEYERHWANIPFEAARKKGWYSGLESSWQEQRRYLTTAINILPENLQEIFNASLEELRPKEKSPQSEGFTPVPPRQMRSNFTCNQLLLQFDPRSGISYLKDTRTGFFYASYNRPLGQYIYSTYNSEDYDKFFREYGYCYGEDSCWYLPLDFGKPGVDAAQPQNKTWFGQTVSLWKKEDENNCYFEQELKLPEETFVYYGASQSIWVSYRVSKSDRKIQFDYSFFGKTATRLPESHWVYFNPVIPQRDGDWKIHIIDSQINPSNVVINGSHSLFPTLEGVSYFNKRGDLSFHIEPLDSAVLSVGAPSPFPFLFPSSQRIMSGFYFNVMNNMWGTNYVLWYPFDKANEQDKNVLSRFILTF